MTTSCHFLYYQTNDSINKQTQPSESMFSLTPQKNMRQNWTELLMLLSNKAVYPYLTKTQFWDSVRVSLKVTNPIVL